MEFRLSEQEFIFAEERPFSSCHASTVTTTPNGDILVAWFAGSREGASDVAIWLARKQAGRWSVPQKVADAHGIPHWNPVLFTAPDGRVLLFYKIGREIPKWQTMVMESGDNGLSWSKARQLVPGDRGGRGPVKNKPIVLKSGTWAAPASLEGDYWDAFVDLSKDGGRTWQPSAVVPLNRSGFAGKGIIQPSLWESEPQHVHMLLRSTNRAIYRSDSRDGGVTWSTAYATSLPNNNSGIDLTRMADGTLVLAYNPVAENWGKRTPLVVAVSSDNGASWRNVLTLESGEGEFSYPAIIAVDLETILITYTWQRERIVFCSLSRG